MNWGLSPDNPARLFGLEEPVINWQSAVFKKYIFWHAFKVGKTRGIAKFDGLEPGVVEKNIELWLPK